jgi:hypothetical protein
VTWELVKAKPGYYFPEFGSALLCHMVHRENASLSQVARTLFHRHNQEANT